MATISNISVCSGGDHISLTITTAQGSRVVKGSIADMMASIDDVSKMDFILAQVRSLIRANPSDTPLQRRTRIQTTVFME